MASDLVRRLIAANEIAHKPQGSDIFYKAAERIDFLENKTDQLSAGRDYLMTVQADEITIEDALEAFGFGRNGLDT